jgi:AraC-like DNA-binding protein
VRSSLDVYRECPPPDALSSLVECFWWHEEAGLAAEPSGVILPDGRVDVIWTSHGRTLVAGPQEREVARPLATPFLAVGARFHPGVGPPLLGLSAPQLVDAHVPLEAIDTRAAAALRAALEPLEDPGDAVEGLTRALVRLAEQAAAVDPLMRGAVRLLHDADATVGHVAAQLALSERQLQRRFRHSVGYGPKTLQRILRFQRLLGELERDEPHGLARIAASAGYADQAHMTRESRALSGLSPRELERLWRA